MKVCIEHSQDNGNASSHDKSKRLTMELPPVGSTRKISFNDGAVQEVKIVELSGKIWSPL